MMATRGKIEYYETPSGWEWRMVAANGEILAHGAEVFASKQSCLRSIETTVEYFVGYNKQGLLVETNYMVEDK